MVAPKRLVPLSEIRQYTDFFLERGLQFNSVRVSSSSVTFSHLPIESEQPTVSDHFYGPDATDEWIQQQPITR